jgi:hypothetical protein
MRLLDAGAGKLARGAREPEADRWGRRLPGSTRWRADLPISVTAFDLTGTSPSVPVSFDQAKSFRDNGARAHQQKVSATRRYLLPIGRNIRLGFEARGSLA